MTSNKDLAIEMLTKEFEKMSNLVLGQLDLLEEILGSDDKVHRTNLAETLKSNETELDNFEILLDTKIVQAIVLYKPVASDLRHIFAIYRMMINIERIGDHIIKIYKFNKDLNDKYIKGKSTQYLVKMLQSATKMVRNSILSFSNADVDSAIATIQQDEEIDRLNEKILKKTLSKMNIDKDSQAMIFDFVDVRSMVSAVERIGDQATNIAEAAIYAITGTNMAHKDI